MESKEEELKQSTDIIIQRTKSPKNKKKNNKRQNSNQKLPAIEEADDELSVSLT